MILLKNRTPITMSMKPINFYGWKISWPIPGFKRKKVHTTITRICSMTERLAAEVFFVVKAPSALKKAAAQTNPAASIIKLVSYLTC